MEERVKARRGCLDCNKDSHGGRFTLTANVELDAKFEVEGNMQNRVQCQLGTT